MRIARLRGAPAAPGDLLRGGVDHVEDQRALLIGRGPRVADARPTAPAIAVPAESARHDHRRIARHLLRHELVAHQEIGLFPFCGCAVAVAGEPRIDLVAHALVEQRVLGERISGLPTFVARCFAQRRIEPRERLQLREVELRLIVIRAHAHGRAGERENSDRDERKADEPHRKPPPRPSREASAPRARIPDGGPGVD